MRIEALADQRDKQITLANVAAVNGHRGIMTVWVDQCATKTHRRICETQLRHHARPPFLD